MIVSDDDGGIEEVSVVREVKLAVSLCDAEEDNVRDGVALGEPETSAVGELDTVHEWLKRVMEGDLELDRAWDILGVGVGGGVRVAETVASAEGVNREIEREGTAVAEPVSTNVLEDVNVAPLGVMKIDGEAERNTVWDAV